MLCVAASINIVAQSLASGKCGKDVTWTFDGKTLTIKNVSKDYLTVSIRDYNTTNQKAPWLQKKLDVRSVRIGENIGAIGSCAFAGMENITEVIFEDNLSVTSIGWGAFLNCRSLSNISLPPSVKLIGTVAFANCSGLNSIRIPDKCVVQDQAFLNCTGVRSISVSPTASLGQYVFAYENKTPSGVRHTLYSYEIGRLPADINVRNCYRYGIAPEAVERLRSNGIGSLEDYDLVTSEIDSIIPNIGYTRSKTYALIIGNQNYRFAPSVPFAIHDARVFREYCEKTLGVPQNNIHYVQDGTKHMIMEEERSWLESIGNRQNKRLIVYYAGHGVPDTKKQNKAYLLPTDVLAAKPHQGIDMNEFYTMLGDMEFEQISVFMDACFSGITRDNQGVTEGTRGVEIEAEETSINSDNIVVFSAAQGNETAQGFQREGHGLFTYYLIKGIKETSGTANFGDLSDYIKYKVSTTAPNLKLRKPQTPVTTASSNVGDDWRLKSF